MENFTRMLPTPYVANLRAFEPLEAFDVSDQLRWQDLSTVSS